MKDKERRAHEKVAVFSRFGQAAVPVLIERASRREVITYGEIARQFGIHWRGYPLNGTLGFVKRLCIVNNLPGLQTLVVRASNQLPGMGVFLEPERTVRMSEAEFKQAVESEWERIWQVKHERWGVLLTDNSITEAERLSLARELEKKEVSYLRR